LFNYDSFIKYTKSIDDLIRYIEDTENLVNPEKLILYGGHYWQRGSREKLSGKYIYDMKTLVEKIRKGTSEEIPVSNQFKYLDTNFRYGTATITWNKADAAKYAGTFSGS